MNGEKKNNPEHSVLEEKKSGSKDTAKPQTGENRLEREEGFITPNDPPAGEINKQSEEAHEISNREMRREN